jgi:hypothetical protein
MTRVGGGALAAVGVIALGVAPFVRYTGTWYRSAKPHAQVTTTVTSAVIAPVTMAKQPAAPKADSPKAKSSKPSPDCAPGPGRSRKNVAVVDHIITNQTAKTLDGCK